MELSSEVNIICLLTMIFVYKKRKIDGSNQSKFGALKSIMCTDHFIEKHLGAQSVLNLTIG